jgi:hypothetical protein
MISQVILEGDVCFTWAMPGNEENNNEKQNGMDLVCC